MKVELGIFLCLAFIVGPLWGIFAIAVAGGPWYAIPFGIGVGALVGLPAAAIVRLIGPSRGEGS